MVTNERRWFAALVSAAGVLAGYARVARTLSKQLEQ
jgi:hypothetical protein